MSWQIRSEWRNQVFLYRRQIKVVEGGAPTIPYGSRAPPPGDPQQIHVISILVLLPAGILFIVCGK